jgi:hypothetical protein
VLVTRGGASVYGMGLAEQASKLKRTVRQAGNLIRDREGFQLIGQVRSDHLTYLSSDALFDLRHRAKDIETRGVSGAIVEAGCALGGSAIVLARSKSRGRDLFVYDVFGMIPPPGEKDGEDVQQRYADIIDGKSEGLGGNTYYGYESHLVDKVEANFDRFGVPLLANNVKLVEGLFQDTLRPQWPVALAHLDGDWYESVNVCLSRIWPALSVGGAVVVDDYFAWSGCRQAVDDFTADLTGCVREHRARLHLVKV